MLALAEVEERHDSGLFVLGWVALDDFVDEAFILGSEFKGDRRVVVGGVSVLDSKVVSSVEI